MTNTDYSFHPPSTLKVARAIGWVTYLEIVRDKVLYNILLCAGFLLSIGYLASQLTFIRPGRVILNFGLTGVTLSCSMIAIFIGSGLLNKEFERRTVYVALSHPISRAQFLIGKFVGLGLVLFLNWLLMSAAYFLILYQTSSELALFKPTLYIALILTFVNSLLMASVTVFFSSFSTTSLSTIMSIGIYLIGNNITALRNVTTKLPVGIGKTLLKFVTPLLPNLEHFNLGFTVTYGLPVTTESLLLRLLYGVSLSALFLAAAGTTIRTKEI